MRVFGRKLERRGAHHSHSLLTRPDQKKENDKDKDKDKGDYKDKYIKGVWEEIRE